MRIGGFLAMMIRLKMRESYYQELSCLIVFHKIIDIRIIEEKIERRVSYYMTSLLSVKAANSILNSTRRTSI